MSTKSTHTMPVILCSAQDLNTADSLISELIDYEIVQNTSDNTAECRIWRLLNKYYRAEVRLYPVCDGVPPPLDVLDFVEAHIIYIKDLEADIVDCAEKRLCHKIKPDVCLLLYEGAQIPTELEEWARSHHYESVPLKEIPPKETNSNSDTECEEPFRESYGIERVRAALHAHTWQGLVRLDLPEQNSSCIDELWSYREADESNMEGWESDCEEQVERAEAFAAALGALRRVGGAARAAGEGEGDAERRRRAECALAALCRALGTPLHSL